MFCGIGKVPKNKTRGTPEYCINNNQVRYYGLVGIDEKLLDKYKKTKTQDLQKELMKSRKLGWDAQYLVKQANNLKVIINNKDERPSKIKSAEKKLEGIRKKRDVLLAKIKKQNEIVKELTKQKAKNDEMEAKRKAKEEKVKAKEKEMKTKEKEKVKSSSKSKTKSKR